MVLRMFLHLKKSYLFSIAALFMLISLPISSAYGEDNFRGLWITRSSLVSKKSIDEVIQTVHENGFNNLVVQVRGRGDAFYNSTIVPTAEQLKDMLKSFDPLRYFISEAHKKNMRVHCWFNVFMLWSSPNKPKNLNHMYHKRPDWFCIPYSNNINRSSQSNADIIFVSPGITGVQTHLYDVIIEVVEHYNIDGIHLDYIRYPGDRFGYNAILKKKFERKHNVDPLELAVRSEDIIKSYGEEGYRNLKKEWNDFRAEQITNFVGNLKNTLIKKKRSMILSAAVIPDINRAKNIFFQYWDEWIKEGYIDLVIPMNYEVSLNIFRRNLESMLQSIEKEKIVMGISAANQSKYKLASKVFISRAMGINSFCIFSYTAYKKFPEVIDLF